MLKFVEKYIELVYKVLKRRQRIKDGKIKVGYYNLFNRFVLFIKFVEKLF